MVEVKQARCVRIGCQGWNYDDWVTGRGSEASVFYPHGTRTGDMLGVYASVFESVEVDSTFYAVPAISTVDGWMKKTPPHFSFSLKLPQEITHVQGLRGRIAAETLAEFCDRVRMLQEKLGVVLVQLPPQFELTPENGRALKEFLPQLPGDMRFSIEFRSPDWMDESVLKMLAEHNVSVALVEGQWIKRAVMWRLMQQPTADFAYVRWMGERDLTRFDVVQRVEDENLRAWRERLVEMCGRVPDVFAYFSNFYEGHAPASANKLKRLLRQPTIEAADLDDQPSLF
jgi:uncharacterized protein YecE (DUF72 family)